MESSVNDYSPRLRFYPLNTRCRATLSKKHPKKSSESALVLYVRKFLRESGKQTLSGCTGIFFPSCTLPSSDSGRIADLFCVQEFEGKSKWLYEDSCPLHLPPKLSLSNFPSLLLSFASASLSRRHAESTTAPTTHESCSSGSEKCHELIQPCNASQSCRGWCP